MAKIVLTYISETAHYLRRLIRFNASSNPWKDREKRRYLILREAHTLEKALSLRSPRKGFGAAKAEHLISSLKSYGRDYGTQDGFLGYPCSIIAGYLSYSRTSGVDVSSLESAFRELDSVVYKGPAGVMELSSDSIRKAAAGNFSQVMESRHSIRAFTSEKVDRQLIIKALEIAAHTPSACNRQAWKTHVFEGEKVSELLRWQGGCSGFENEIHTAVLVCADMRGFLYYEPFQQYVDGGMYAMNLVNALHSLGLGTIPLSCGFVHSKLAELRRFGVPEEESPILIIGAGYLEDTVKVAVSTRKNISETNTFCEE